MDTHFIKLTGTAEVPENLDENQYYTVGAEIDYVNSKKTPNHDGSNTWTHTWKINRLMTADRQGKKMPAKVKGSLSTTWRKVLWHRDPDEDFYNKVMSAMIAEPDKVLEALNIQ